MSNYSKSIKRLLRQWATKAYERDLHRELNQLDRSFAEWRAGKIDSGELSYRIHHYETGASRELLKRYNNSPHDRSLAYAVVVGSLQLDELPAELLEAIERHLSFFQSLKDRDELSEPGHYPATE